ncbi:type II toxin-antitoxin system RelE/ParE family toxin [Nostoc sp. WHI]|uniref:type II toxin-antitoxin system RelE/ParE family toxin n=1 Tax=Nostoc sp. WHI TaxID=2650611 RepID=UPI0018C7A841|nr:type II toxin-antitoxin system RelE/ParE family toxin [Nostoc sp. WHI]MBG1269799.1 type II toxin-antitoxin system RelE/ParE family toxin [Nostoc sp. WHI]
MSQIVWTLSAIDDLNRHYDFIKLNNPDAAARAVQAIVSSGESLQQNPRRGAIVDEIAGLRKLLVSFGKYGFIIHYVILEDDVVILRIYHGRENRPR